MTEYQVTLTGRNVEIPEHFEERIHQRLARVAKLDPTLIMFDVELKHEKNPRRDATASKVQITATGSGHLARAEAAGDSFYSALEDAVDKMERSLRKVKVRRERAKSGHRAPIGMGEMAAMLVRKEDRDNPSDDLYEDTYADSVEEHVPGSVVRSKEHDAVPMTVEDALGNMEALDHDFYLFIDSATGKPTVVYRRHSYEYGMIALNS